MHGKTPEQRFWEKVDQSGECWVWTRAKSHGYGVLRVSGKLLGAHTFSYQLNVGPIPEGMEVDHRCRNRACVRPAHLRLATRKQNKENRGLSTTTRSGVLGVSWESQTQRWRAQVKHNGHNYRLGRFHTVEEAAEAARLKRLELFTHNDADRTVSM